MNVQLMSPVGGTGYGYVGLNIIQELAKNHNIGYTPIGQPNVESQAQADLLNHCISVVHLIPDDSPSLKIWHQFDLLVRPGKGKYYAFPFFEVDKFNQKELYHLNSTDEIVVSCKWAKDIIQNNNISKPVHIVNMGVDTEIFNPNNNQITDNYIFITIGKWEKRKAHDIIIECFGQAFDSKDNVELWMVTNNPFLNKEEEAEWTKRVDSSPLREKIKVFPRLPNHQAVAQVLGYADCGIYISRGEGWNLELLETMAMNKPVIASNYSAHTEYCTPENSFLVNIAETEPAIDNKWFFGDSNWAKIDQDQKDQTIEHMRFCYSNRVLSNPAGLETAQTLSWKNSCHQLLGCML